MKKKRINFINASKSDKEKNKIYLSCLQLAYEEEFGDWYENGNLAYWLSPEKGEFTYVDCYGDSSILTDKDTIEEYWKGKK